MDMELFKEEREESTGLQVEKLEEKDRLEDLGVDRRTLKWTLQEQDGRSASSGQGPVAGCCAQGN